MIFFESIQSQSPEISPISNKSISTLSQTMNLRHGYFAMFFISSRSLLCGQHPPDWQGIRAFNPFFSFTILGSRCDQDCSARIFRASCPIVVRVYGKRFNKSLATTGSYFEIGYSTACWHAYVGNSERI
ncbi:hypothetical protein K461DRAFT_18600 [Myriangium duriaei CBS 260.36]|uniref:Uncharacterized protein n=1 Tax=Myriangium duriaei CBS 260.36 TaxID=1168546 RepID=A0A9P4J8U2_9PEZI|nr:hypothetical protein K461DRAFT_18600 [Myriangium duriaei CBS 260.36]